MANEDVLTIENGVVTKCKKNAVDVVIPAGVTEIGGWAFNGCKSLTSVVIPESVKKIGWNAFEDCESLSSVVIPSSVKVIGDSGFYGLKLLRLVEIPYSVTVIGRSAFSGCTSLSEITYGCTVAQWNAVYKASYWHNKVPATVVKCSDGDVKL